jgi:4-amino-4-deoxy-L-arabinose transferase-like glycosyltransferase
MLLVAVLAAALAMRLAVLLGLRDSVYWSFLLWDERTYDGWARGVLTGSNSFIYTLSALPAYVVAAAYWMLGPDPVYVRLLNVALGVATCAVVYAIGRELAGGAVGLLAALAAAMYRPFVFFSVTLLKEPLALLLFGALVYVFLIELREHRGHRVIALGVLMGLLVNVRQNAGIVSVVLVPAILWRRFDVRRGRGVLAATAVFLAGFGASSAPFVIANYRGTGRISPAPLAGFDLYLGNNLAGKTPFYSPVQFASTHPDEQGIQFTIEASRRLGRRLSLAEGSSYWADQVVRSAVEHPGPFARRLLHKALVIFSHLEESDNHSLEFVGAFVPVLRLPFLGFGLVMPLALCGLAISAREDRRARLLAGALLAYAATLVIWFSNMRIRAPMLVVLLPYAIVGLRGLLGAGAWGPGARRTGVAALILGAALEFVPVPGTGDLTAHYNTHALALLSAGQTEEAERYWRTSSAMQGAWSVYADVGLAMSAAARGDTSGAFAWLERIDDTSFAAPNKYDAIGDVRRGMNDLPGAAAAYERSLGFNSSQRYVHGKLLEVYRLTDPGKVRDEEARLRDVIDSFAAAGRAGSG